MRTPGVEPGSQAWKACMIPLHYVRHSPPNATNDTRCPAARPTKPDMRKPNEAKEATRDRGQTTTKTTVNNNNTKPKASAQKRVCNTLGFWV